MIVNLEVLAGTGRTFVALVAASKEAEEAALHVMRVDVLGVSWPATSAGSTGTHMSYRHYVCAYERGRCRQC